MHQGARRPGGVDRAEPAIGQGAVTRRAIVSCLAAIALGGQVAPARRRRRRRKRRGGEGETPATADPSFGAAAFGAFVPGAPHDPGALDAFARRVGRMPAVVAYYRHWGGSSPSFDPALPRCIADRGAVPLVTWEPWDPRRGLNQTEFAPAAIAAGAHDDYARGWAEGLAAHGGPVLLRFAHEMNGSWYPWAVGVNGVSAADYVAAWTRLRGIFAAAGADNVRWVWSPNVDFPGASPLLATFPGDGLVDWVALDGYNWGASRPDTTWRSFGAVFGPSYDGLRAATGKPVLIAETACAEQGGDKARWIAEGLRETLPRRFPAVRAVVWFDQDKEADWRVDSSRAALKAVRAAVADPVLQGALVP